MRVSTDAHQKMKAASDLLGQDMLSIAAFENVRALIKGLHPVLDGKLEAASKALHTLEKLQTGDIITLSAEHLPEESEKQKKRKKALIFFINCVKDLRSEVQRLETELNSSPKNTTDSVLRVGRIVKFAKGPFGLVTLAALVIVIALPFLGHRPAASSRQATPTFAKNQLQVITYQGKQLPLSQLYVGHGPDCDSPHYHATTGKVTALDGSVVVDPEGCGFGKVGETKITTITQ